MAVFAGVPSGLSLSSLASTINSEVNLVRAMERGSTPPTLATRQTGQLWACTDATTLSAFSAYFVGSVPSEAILRWDGVAWVLQDDQRYPALNANGTVKAAADLDLNSHKLVNVAAATASGHAVNAGQLARYNGVAAFIETLVQRAATPGTANLVEAVTGDSASRFTPRQITLRIYGDVTPAGGGAVLGTIDQTITYNRWEGDVPAGFTGTYGRVVLATLTIGGETVEVAVEVVTTPGSNGFYFELKQTSGTPAFMEAEVAQAWCTGGIGQ